MPSKIWRNGLLVMSLLAFLVTFGWHAAARAEGQPAQAAAGTPQVHFPQTKYTFEPLMEGSDITHDFIIENKGQAVLTIHKVQPD